MLDRLLDEYTWHGKGIRMILSAPKVAVVLVFFFGIFVVIAFDSLAIRLRNGRVIALKGAARNQQTASSPRASR